MVNECKKYPYIFQEKAKLHNLHNARIIYLDNSLLSSLEKQFDRFQMKHQKKNKTFYILKLQSLNILLITGMHS